MESSPGDREGSHGAAAATRALPESAAWRHRDARDGFECVFISRDESGAHHFDGHTAAVEGGQPWVVSYDIAVDTSWRTRYASVRCRSRHGVHEVDLRADGAGHWRVNGVAAPHLDGCHDVDLESSALTNTFPIHRLRLRVDDDAAAPAAYVRALDLTVERLEQHYVRLDDSATGPCYGYRAPQFDVAARLDYDAAGLAVNYPGIAERVL